MLGVPVLSKIVVSWLTSLDPGNNGFRLKSSAMMHPMDQRSTGVQEGFICSDEGCFGATESFSDYFGIHRGHSSMVFRDCLEIVGFSGLLTENENIYKQEHIQAFNSCSF